MLTFYNFGNATAFVVGGLIGATILQFGHESHAAYMALFGVGSTFGMAVLSGLLGWPLARLGGHARTWRTISLLVGCLSTALGVAWGAPLLTRLIF